MIPSSLKKLMEIIHDKGYEIYVVGGAVRDTIMGRNISDWDLTTNATPDIIQGLFKKTVDIGIKFGTVQVHFDKEEYEITTYRKDSIKSDGRKPDYVEFTLSLKEDLSRRDFTINAMVMDKDGNIFDYFEGKSSLQKKMLMSVGDAKLRFTEDYLRVYRYIRLTQELAFNINKEIDEAILELPINNSISFERVKTEFNKILLSHEPSRGIKHLKDLNLLPYIIPGIEKTYSFRQHSKYHHLDVFAHTLSVVDKTPKNLELRLAALFHDIGKPPTFELIEGEGHFYGHDKVSESIAVTCMKRLKYSNESIRIVSSLIKSHMRLLDINNTGSIKKFIRKIGSEEILMWVDLRKADILSCKSHESINEINNLEEKIINILNEVPPLSINDLAVDGHDLMTLGFLGKDIGIIKNKLLEIVDSKPEFNNKTVMIDYIKKNLT